MPTTNPSSPSPTPDTPSPEPNGDQGASTPEAWVERAKSLLKDQKPNEAAQALNEALKLDEDFLPAKVEITRLRFNPQQPQLALQLLRQLLEQNQNDAAVHHLASELFLRAGDLEKAETHARNALDLDDAIHEPCQILAQVCQQPGRVREALDHMEAGLKRKPGDPQNDSNILFVINYFQPDDPKDEFNRIAQYNTHFKDLTPADPEFKNDPDPDRPLRVAYMSPDFRWHSVAHVALAPLRAHDRKQIEVYCYGEYQNADLNTLRFQDAADHWIATKGMSDEELADKIREDQIDILIEMAGHTAHHRLGVMARRPAPVQAAWLGYSNTRGLKTIDYRLSDEYGEPDTPHYNNLSTETVTRLPETYHCYQPPEEDPPLRPAPCLRDGVVTFGSFNNYRKQTPEVLALWARILNAVPDSRLLLKSGDYQHAGVKIRLLEELGKHGIDPKRIRLVGMTPSAFRHLDLYGEMDIYLDPYPYNGTITTLEALWMGLPSVALLGNVHRARISASLLHCIGRDEWIAETEDEYFQIAVDLASDPQKLDALRPQIREQMKNSPLCDPDTFTRNLESAYRQWWHTWISNR
ncbi:MAG: tetratricopeptide repeat protein [Verrucomicrobiota bacterium]